MRIDVKKYDENCYYTHVGIPTTKYVNKRWRKWAMLRKYMLGINPPGFHNWTQDEYIEHIQYLDDLIEGY